MIMREIKFRGKSIYTHKWEYGNLRIFGERAYISDLDSHAQSEVQLSTIGQFTGLTDCNGREIYEGDKVRFYDDIEDKQVTSHVIYHKESCSFCVAPTELCGDYIGLTTYWQFEVIGNIHDNPELIPNQPTAI